MNRVISIALTAIGMNFIIVYRYIAVAPIIMIYWTGTSMIACFYVIPVSNILIQFDKLAFRPIRTVG